jgi:hypothetical protein
MYTVDGEPVTYIDLKPASAKVLLYSPNPIGTAHGENIRPGKSIRLGGYFYVPDENMSTIVDWIGNNLDVFSLGFGGTIHPDNITSIRGLNPGVRFYYMAFATTLFENPSGSTGPTWGNSHYPRMQLNTTMRDWVLKLENGSDALGVRSESYNDDAHLMDLGDMDWADYFAWIYQNRCIEYHADGVAIDEVMWKGYWNVDTLDDDRGNDYNNNELLADYKTIPEITATCYQWLERIQSKMSVEIITQAFWDSAQDYQDGIWGEASFRAAGQYGDKVDDINSSIFYEGMTWHEIIENMKYHGEQNRSYIWAAWYNETDPTSLEYAIGSYLMGKSNNRTCLVFHPQDISGGTYPTSLVGYSVKNVMNQLERHKNLYDLEMGDALGDMREVYGIGGKAWRRDFENGIVFVNPHHSFIPGFE